VAIERFAKVHLVAHRAVREEVVAELQRLGVVEIAGSEALPAPAPQAADGEATELLRRVDAAIRDLSRHRPSPTLRERIAPRRRRLSEEELAALAEGFDVAPFLAGLDALRSRAAGARAERERLLEERRRLEPWVRVAVPLAALQPRGQAHAATGFIPAARADALAAAVARAGGVLHRAGTESRRVAVVLFAHRDAGPGVAAAAAAAGFEPAPLPALAATPGERIAAIDAALASLAGTAAAAEHGIAEEAGRLDDLMAVRDFLGLRHERGAAQQSLGATLETVSLEGWMPAALVEEARLALGRRFPLLALEAYPPGPGDRVPVALRNRGLVRPFEVVVELYGLPRYGGIDPTTILGAFFAVFFGVCLTDAGYGALLAAVAGALLLVTPREFAARRRFLALFALAGVAAVAVGAAAGGWFGAAAGWRLFDPLRDLLPFFGVALLLGAAHVFAGLLLAMVHDLRRGRILAPLVDQGLWIAFVGGLLALLAAKVSLLPASAGPVGGVLAVFAASGILCFQGRGTAEQPRGEALRTAVWAGFSVALALSLLGRGWPWTGGAAAVLLAGAVFAHGGRVRDVLSRLGIGLYALYGGVGYMSDLLSYSRLVALGLGSSTVAMVVNTMAGLALEVPAAGPLLGGLVFVGGHLFNLVISLLGAFVHSSRLQYVEFFTKFYGAGGRAFAPFRMAPRHVTIVAGGPAGGAAAGG